MTDTKFMVEDARQVLANRAYKSAFERMADFLEKQALNCDIDNKDKAMRVIVSKQILVGIKRELERLIMDGEVESIKMNELESRRKSLFRR
jgi:hypothetical protein